MKKVAIYMRLSKEDEYIRDESNSISNQRAFLRRHIRSIPELKRLEVIEFKDDGYTGKNMNRPGVQELLDMVKAQKIECIVVKDISRFSRDHLETGKYLEQIFPFMGVRFIAVNDNYDSKDFAGGIGEIDVTFKGILYDFYSEDLSQKVKSSIAARKAKGNYTASVATYGYKKDPEKKGHLIVDEEAAEIVKRIYREYLDGRAIYKIAQGLNDDGIVVPSIHLKRKIGNGYIRHNATLLWTTVCVRRMLCNQTYLGHVVYHKYEQESVGGNDKKILDPAEWKIVKNMHEPLISQKDFDKAQKRLRSNKKVKKVYPKHCLSGMVECGICGHNMRHANSGRPKYECAFTYFNINHKHERNSIIDTEIEAAVLAALRKEMDLKAESGKICAERKELQRSKADEAQKCLKDMERSLDQLYEDQRESFESYKAGMTEKDTFLQQKQIYEQMEECLKDKIRQQKEAVERLEDEADAMPDGFSADQDEIRADQLTREMTEAFVEKVIVWPGQKLEIKWKIRK